LPVTRQKARFATGLPATVLAGLDFHQLDSFERFIRSLESPFPKLCLARYSGYPLEVIHVAAEIQSLYDDYARRLLT